MNDSTLISVIIPTYQRADRLVRAVESVLGQSDASFELIVVDDGSTDATARRMEPYAARVGYHRREHSGVSAARHAGVRLARGQWLAFLDSDDEWLSGKLSAQRQFHRDNPDLRVSQTGEIWIRNGVRVNPCKHHAKPRGDVFVASLNRCLVSPSAVMLHRDIFDEVGGFDEDLPVCEDYDLWLRLGSRVRFGLVEEALVIKYGGHADQLSRQYWGMDRFRVTAIRKLLERQCLDGHRRDAALRVLEKKCRVLAKGARRRGRGTEAGWYEQMVLRYAVDV